MHTHSDAGLVGNIFIFCCIFIMQDVERFEELTNVRSLSLYCSLYVLWININNEKKNPKRITERNFITTLICYRFVFNII